MSRRDRWGPEGPPEEAYSRVTDAERFRPLHEAMLEIVGRLERDFDVEREEGYGLDEELEKHFEPTRPGVRLTPSDPHAAPISVVFSGFPGLHLRFGRWYMEPFPSCGCDACDETAEDEIERLTEMIDDVVAGRFREGIRIALPHFNGPGGMDAWRETGFWSPTGRSLNQHPIDRQSAERMTGGRPLLDLDWKPWPRRQAVG